MDEIALVTYSRLPEGDPDDLPLARALERAGVRPVFTVWDAPRDWSRFRAAVIRSTWDYLPRRRDFVAWAEDLAGKTRLWNPPAVIRWNTHKGYLRELEQAGIPVVPTEWMAPGDPVDLGRRLRPRGWESAVIKPAVGAGGEGAVRFEVLSPEGLASGERQVEALLSGGMEVMVQPFLPEVLGVGERSLVFLGGELSHEVRKRPAFSARGGSELAQNTLAGTAALGEPEGLPVPLGESESKAARAVLEAAAVDVLYARVDLVETGGVWRLMELELTEPTLFLRGAPGAAERLAGAILRST